MVFEGDLTFVGGDSSLSMLLPSPASITVGAAGATTLTRSDGDALVGGVSPAGHFIGLSGGTLARDNPAFLVIVR